MSQGLTFGYFNFFGRGQIARLLLAYTSTQYKDISYSFSNINDWLLKDKQQLGLDFPSLPYLIEKGKLKLTQSRAIQKFIIYRARRSDLLGKNNKEKARIDNIDGVLRDIFNALVELFSETKNFQDLRKNTFDKISQKLHYLDCNLDNKSFFLNRVTYVDFVLAIVFEFVKFFYPHQKTIWKNIQKVSLNVNSLPQIKKYYQLSTSVSCIIPPEKINDPRFASLKAIKSIQKQQILSQIKDEDPKDQSSRGQEQVRQLDIQSSGLNEKQILQEKDIEQQIQGKYVEIRKTQSSLQQNNFQSKVSSYMRAVSETDNKLSNSIKNTRQNDLIVSSSGISSKILIKQDPKQVPWRITQEKENNLNKQQNASNSICLGYWGIRGLGQIQRHLLTYCGIRFTQKLYKTQQQWFNGDKNILNLHFPNLPYLICNEFKITQSLAIDRYIIRISQKKDLLGKNIKDQSLVQNFVKILSEFFKQLRVLCFTQDIQKKKSQQLLQKFKPSMFKMDQFIGSKPYALDYLTWIDFYIGQISYYIQKIYPQTYQKLLFFKNIRNSIESNLEIQKYYKGNDAVKSPFMPPSAKIAF